jgi:hypothetical protein
MRAIPAVIVALSLFLAACGSENEPQTPLQSPATTEAPMLDRLVADSDIVIVGRVISADASAGTYEVRAEELLHGELRASTLTVAESTVTGPAFPKAGNSYVLFLAKMGSRADYVVVRMPQGRLAYDPQAKTVSALSAVETGVKLPDLALSKQPLADFKRDLQAAK